MSKVRNLPEVTALQDDDILYAVDVSEGPNAGRKVKVSTIKTAVIANAAEIPYSNVDSTLQATDVEDALDELDAKANDHSNRHLPNGIDSLTTAEPVTVNADGENDAGTANAYSRADHKHHVSTGVPSAIPADQANAAGTSSNLARADHIHQIVTATAVEVGAANAQGVASTFSKSDHVHEGVHGLKANDGTLRYGDVSLVNGSGVSVVDDGQGNFTIDTVAGPNEFVLVNTSGLIVSYTGGHLRFDSDIINVVSGNIILASNITNGRIYVDSSGTVLQTGSNVDAPPYSYVLADFSTNGNMVISLVDRRVFMNQKIIRGSAGDVSTITPDAAAAQGSTFTFADTGHVHAIACAAAATQTPDQANAEGASSSFARADHVHQIVTAAPSTTLDPSIGNTQGAASSFSRADHTHAIATALVADITTIQPDAAAAAGTANTFARGDHRHAIAAAAAATQTPDQANGEGVSTSFARADHVHQIATAVPVNTGTANAQGVSTSFARADHVHDTIVANFAASATGDITTASLTDVVLDSMTLTPGAGTYLILFSASTVNSGNGAERNYFSIYANGVQVTATERKVGIAGGAYVPVSISAPVTVGASQAIDIRWRVIAGTGTTSQRRLMLIRLG
jgi:hypothetical protein